MRMKKMIQMIKKQKLYVGYLYGVLHFCLEFICFYILAAHFSINGLLMVGVAFFYDLLAFAPQIVWGYLYDTNRKLYLEWIGTGAMFLAVLLVQFHGPRILLLIALTMGNAILHETGAVVTTSASGGMLSHSAIFVGGGSFGLICGQTLGRLGGSLWWNYLALLVILVVILLTQEENYHRKKAVFKIANPKLKLWVIILIALVVVIVRSFLSYAIPISWKKELWQSFLLFFIMGLGKALGGILADRFGARLIGVCSALCCIPFLVVGDENMIISVIGVFLFSMNMPITFGMLLSVIPSAPGVAFGVTTIGLFLGLLPAMFFNIEKDINIILVIVLSIVCAGLLWISTNKKNAH